MKSDLLADSVFGVAVGTDIWQPIYRDCLFSTFERFSEKLLFLKT